MSSLEELEDEDVKDFFLSKGSVIDSFKKEFLDLEKEYDTVIINTSQLDREYDAFLLELSGLRDQVSLARRTTDEISSSAETVKEAIDLMTSKNENMMENERSDRGEISVYTGYFEELRNALSIGADWQPEQQEQKKILDKERDFVQSKSENKISQINGTRADIDRFFQYIQKLEGDITSFAEQQAEIETKTFGLNIETAESSKLKEDYEKKVYDIRNNILKSEQEIIERNRTLKSDEYTLSELDNNIKKTKDLMERYIKDYDDLYSTLQTLGSELERQRHQNKKLDDENEDTERIIDGKIKENEQLMKELNTLNQLREAVNKKCSEVEDEKRSTEDRRDALNRQMSTNRNVESKSIRKEIDLQDKSIANLRQEGDILRKKFFGSDKSSRTIQDYLVFNSNGKRNLMNEQKILEEEVFHCKNQIGNLVAEKEKFEHEIEIANQQYYTALEELKLQELQIQELQKKMHDDQSKLKTKQNLYEAVRSDRNLYSKQLVESQDAINELKRRFRAMNHMIDQLKDEISTKDHAIVKEHFLHHTVDKERELLKNELTKIRKQLQSSETIIENQRVEIIKLNRITEDGEQERARQKNELASVIAERNLLTSQVIKRNIELNTLYDRIKAQRGALRVGERQYAKVYEGIGRWQKELTSLVSSQNETIAYLSGSDDLKTKMVQLEREILIEQTKSRALADELNNPMNVHRWRILESSDPKRFEKITHIQSLQKQLIAKSDQVTQLDLLIQEKEKIYTELKNIIARQPGPEVDEQLLVYQQTLKDKVKQLASMDEELQMYRQQIKIFKDDIQMIEGKLTGLKKQWFKMKKKDLMK